MKISEQGDSKFAVAPAGTHLAVCVSIVDVGTQRGEYQGDVTIRRQIIVGWELPDELIPEGNGEHTGKPFFVSKFYTASLHEKATLRKDLTAWRGRDFTADELKGFEIKAVLGKPCMVTVGLSEKGKAKVVGVTALPKSLRASVPAQPVNALRYFSLDEFNQELFDALPKGYKKMIQESPEYKRVTNPEADHAAEEAGVKVDGAGSVTAAEAADPADDLPF